VANLFSVKDASTRRERHTRQEHRTGWRNLNSYSEFRVYSSQGQETQEANRLGQPYKVCYKPLPREQHLNSYPRLSTAITYSNAIIRPKYHIDSGVVLLYTQSTLTSKLSFRVARLSRLSRLETKVSGGGEVGGLVATKTFVSGPPLDTSWPRPMLLL